MIKKWLRKWLGVGSNADFVNMYVEGFATKDRQLAEIKNRVDIYLSHYDANSYEVFQSLDQFRKVLSQFEKTQQHLEKSLLNYFLNGEYGNKIEQEAQHANSD